MRKAASKAAAAAASLEAEAGTAADTTAPAQATKTRKPRSRKAALPVVDAPAEAAAAAAQQQAAAAAVAAATQQLLLAQLGAATGVTIDPALLAYFPGHLGQLALQQLEGQDMLAGPAAEVGCL